MTTVETLDLLVRSDTDRAQTKLQRFGEAIQRFLGPAAVAAIGTAFVSMLRDISQELDEVADRMDAVGKTATRLDIDPGNLIAWQNAAELAGIEAQALEKLMVRMVDTIGEAEDSASMQAEALERLNLSYERLRNLSPETQFRTILVALDSVANQTDKLTIANEIFGTRGSTALQLLSGGWESLDQEIARAGQSIPENMAEIVRATESANDAMTRMQQDAQNGMAQSAQAMKQAEANVTQAALGMQRSIGRARDEFFAFRLAFQEPFAVRGGGLFAGAAEDLAETAENLIGQRREAERQQQESLRQSFRQTLFGVQLRTEIEQRIGSTFFNLGRFLARGTAAVIPDIQRQVDDVMPAGLESVGAAQRGSLEAFQAVQQAQNNQARLADRQRRQLVEESKRTNNLLSQLLFGRQDTDLAVNPFQLGRR